MTEETQDPTEKMRETIAKLLAKAAGTDSAEEAEIFTAKAHDLMVKWSISEASLRAAGPTDVKPATAEIELSSNHWRENTSIINSIAKALSVKVVVSPYQRGRNPVAHLVGFAEDLDAVKELYVSLSKHVKLTQKQYILERTHGDKPTPKEARQYGSAFRLGFAKRIGVVLEESRAQTIEEVAETTSDLLPMLLNKDVQVQETYAELHPSTKKMRGQRISDAAGYVDGMSAASAANVGQSAIES